MGPHHAHTCALSIHTRTHLSEEAARKFRGDRLLALRWDPLILSQASALPQGFDPGVDGSPVGGLQKQIWVRVEIGWTLQCSRQIGAIRIYDLFLTFFYFASHIIILRFKGTMWI